MVFWIGKWPSISEKFQTVGTGITYMEAALAQKGCSRGGTICMGPQQWHLICLRARTWSRYANKKWKRRMTKSSPVVIHAILLSLNLPSTPRSNEALMSLENKTKQLNSNKQTKNLLSKCILQTIYENWKEHQFYILIWRKSLINCKIMSFWVQEALHVYFLK